MEPLDEALRLIKRQAELETAMRRPGGIRVTEERELFQLRKDLTQFPAAISAIMEAASRMRRPVDTISAEDVEHLTLISAYWRTQTVSPPKLEMRLVPVGSAATLDTPTGK